MGSHTSTQGSEARHAGITCIVSNSYTNDRPKTSLKATYAFSTSARLLACTSSVSRRLVIDNGTCPDIGFSLSQELFPARNGAISCMISAFDVYYFFNVIQGVESRRPAPSQRRPISVATLHESNFLGCFRNCDHVRNAAVSLHVFCYAGASMLQASCPGTNIIRQTRRSSSTKINAYAISGVSEECNR